MKKPARVFNLILGLITLAGCAGHALAASGSPHELPLPTPAQLAWQTAQLGIFFHYDLQVAHRQYQPAAMLKEPPFLSAKPPDTDQWLRVAKAMGARYAVYVCKHNSGYMFFQCRAYPFGLSYSTWLDGKADIVRRFVASCHKSGIQPGLYCSLATNRYWNVSAGRTHNPAAQIPYDRACARMERDLWSHYGPLFYCWFDGGVLPVQKGGANLLPLLRRFQPHMVCFQGPAGAPGGLTRWIGNESGLAPNPCWDTVTAINQAGGGDPHGKYWEPAEVDISVLAGDHWFWRPHGPNRLLSISRLVRIYYESIGHGCNLIINAPIDQYGRVPRSVQRRLSHFGDLISRRFAHPLAVCSGTGKLIRLKLPAAHQVDTVVLKENISLGQRVRRYAVQGLENGHWRTLCSGQSIGRKWIDTFHPVTIEALRLAVSKSVGEPVIAGFAAFDVHGQKPKKNDK